jgi:uncharacterized protein (TIGR02117 family)
MSAVKTCIKFITRALAVVLIILSCYVACYVLVPLVGNGFDENTPNSSVTVFLLKSGVHTDIVVPLKNESFDWTTVFSGNSTSDSSLDYLAIGWGHKKFYMETPTWADLTLENALSATMGRGETALHVRNISRPMAGADTRQILLSSEQYLALCAYIQGSSRQSKQAEPIQQLNYTHDMYYDAKGRYHALRTCNTWVSDALIACGQAGPWWTASTDGLFLKE